MIQRTCSFQLQKPQSRTAFVDESRYYCSTTTAATRKYFAETGFQSRKEKNGQIRSSFYSLWKRPTNLKIFFFSTALVVCLLSLSLLPLGEVIAAAPYADGVDESEEALKTERMQQQQPNAYAEAQQQQAAAAAAAAQEARSYEQQQRMTGYDKNVAGEGAAGSAGGQDPYGYYGMPATGIAGQQQQAQQQPGGGVVSRSATTAGVGTASSYGGGGAVPQTYQEPPQPYGGAVPRVQQQQPSAYNPGAERGGVYQSSPQQGAPYTAVPPSAAAGGGGYAPPRHQAPPPTYYQPQRESNASGRVGAAASGYQPARTPAPAPKQRPPQQPLPASAAGHTGAGAAPAGARGAQGSQQPHAQPQRQQPVAVPETGMPQQQQQRRGSEMPQDPSPAAAYQRQQQQQAYAHQQQQYAQQQQRYQQQPQYQQSQEYQQQAPASYNQQQQQQQQQAQAAYQQAQHQQAQHQQAQRQQQYAQQRNNVAPDSSGGVREQRPDHLDPSSASQQQQKHLQQEEADDDDWLPDKDMLGPSLVGENDDPADLEARLRPSDEGHLFDEFEERTTTQTSLMEEWESHMQNFIPEMLVTFSLPPRSDEYFYETVLPTDKKLHLRGGFFVGGDDTSSSIDFSVTDPQGTVLYKKSKSEGLFYFDAEKNGTYSFIISNHRWMESKMVTFAIGRGNETALMPKHVHTAEEMVDGVHNQLRDIQAETTYLWIRQRSHTEAVSAFQSKLYWLAAMEFACLVTTSFFHVFYIQSLVAHKRIL